MDRVLPTVWRYRWELLPLVIGLAANNIWWLRSVFGTWAPSASDIEALRIFEMLTYLIGVLVLSTGLIWSLWNGKLMVAGLWAVVLVPPAHLLIVYLDGRFLGWIDGAVRLLPANATLQLFSNVVLQIPGVVLAALLAWRLGELGLRHAWLIAAGYLAWWWIPFVIPWTLTSSAGDFQRAIAWAGFGLWMAMFAALAFAFHHFQLWGPDRQRLAVKGLIALPLVAILFQFVPSVVRSWPPALAFWLLLPLVSGALVMGLTWLLATLWPVGRETEVAEAEPGAQPGE